MRSPRTTMKNSPCSPQLEKACAQQRRPNTAKKNNNSDVMQLDMQLEIIILSEVSQTKTNTI